MDTLKWHNAVHFNLLCITRKVTFITPYLSIVQFFFFLFLFTKEKFLLFSTYFLVSTEMSVVVTEMWSTKPPRNIEILWELKTNQHDPIRHIECVDFNLKCKILRSKPDNCLMKTTVHVFVRCLSYQYSFKILTRNRFQKRSEKENQEE